MAERTSFTAPLTRLLYPRFRSLRTSLCLALFRADLWFANADHPPSGLIEMMFEHMKRQIII
jgi:hypothetical protein